MVFADALQILGDLYLRAVGQYLLIFYLLVEVFGFLVVILAEQCLHHTEHALCASGEECYFLLCLKHRYFRRLYEVGFDVFQLEFLLRFFFLLWQYPAYDALDLRDEGDEQCGVCHVETGVEHCEYHG